MTGIAGVKKPEKIVEKKVSKSAEKATEGIKAAVENKIAEAAEAVKVIISDTDGDGQEHNEL